MGAEVPPTSPRGKEKPRKFALFYEIPVARPWTTAQEHTAGALDIPFDYIRDSGAAVVGDPDRCVEIATRYEAAGCDLLLCLGNPYDVPHDAVMRSIELLGKHVIPELDRH